MTRLSIQKPEQVVAALVELLDQCNVFVREQFFLAAAAQNIKRLVCFLSPPITSVLPATT